MDKPIAIHISHFGPHFGEEPVFSGSAGAGAIFFSRCNMRCGFCQNWQISQRRLKERSVTPFELADIMLALQDQGCHNIDLVSPSHQVPGIREALSIVRGKGLGIPVLYNTNCLDRVEALRSLEGLIDIYLPDLKYADDNTAHLLSGVKRYVGPARKALVEMYRQVGHLDPPDPEALARRGLLIRILVLPGKLAGVPDSLLFVKEALGTETWISLLAQYDPLPLEEAGNKEILDVYPELGRRLSSKEYGEAVAASHQLGFENVFLQELERPADWGRPDFQREDPFGGEPREHPQ